MFKYPNPNNNLATVSGVVGSFWPKLYGGAALVSNYLLGSVESENQLYHQLQQLQDSVGRETCPLLYVIDWYYFEILQSQAISPGVYTLPTELVNFYFLTNALTSPTSVQVKDISFSVSGGEVTFLTDPFVDPEFTPEPVIVDNVITDYKIRLWAPNAEVGDNLFYQQFGYLLSLSLSPTQNYKDLVNAILDAANSATSSINLRDAISAITDIPNVKTDGEVVELVTLDANGLVIGTDTNIYRFASTATPIVSVGDTVNAGDQLIDAVMIFSPNRGQVPNISSLTIGPNFFDSTILGPLTFSNSSTALNVTLNVAGYTKVDWALGGAGGDVTQFFTLLHSKGVAATKTLAMLLDLRPQPQATQPTALNLPTTINPMEFLFQNVLRNNAFVVQIKTADQGANALGLSYLDLLRSIIPPHNAMILKEI